MKPIRVTAPALEPVTLAEVKAHARIDHTDDDALLAGLISGAVSELDGYGGLLGRAIMEQTWRQPFAGWSRVLCLPMPDARAVAVTYVDQDGAEQTVDPGLYEVVETHTGSVVRFLTAFSAPSLKTDIMQPVNVIFTAGAAVAADVDQRIKVAIAIMVTHRDAHRGVTTDAREAEVPWGVEQMIAPLRWRITS